MKSCIRCGSCAVNHKLYGHDGSDPELCTACYWRSRAEEKHALLQLAGNLAVTAHDVVTADLRTVSGRIVALSHALTVYNQNIMRTMNKREGSRDA